MGDSTPHHVVQGASGAHARQLPTSPKNKSIWHDTLEWWGYGAESHPRRRLSQHREQHEGQQSARDQRVYTHTSHEIQISGLLCFSLCPICCEAWGDTERLSIYLSDVFVWPSPEWPSLILGTTDTAHITALQRPWAGVHTVPTVSERRFRTWLPTGTSASPTSFLLPES